MYCAGWWWSAVVGRVYRTAMDFGGDLLIAKAELAQDFLRVLTDLRRVALHRAGRAAEARAGRRLPRVRCLLSEDGVENSRVQPGQVTPFVVPSVSAEPIIDRLCDCVPTQISADLPSRDTNAVALSGSICAW